MSDGVMSDGEISDGVMSDRIPFRVQPMLATLVREPFDSPGWVYEEKYDGYRILAYKEAERVTLFSRNAKDRTATFISVAEAVVKLPFRTLLLDGEVLVFDRRHVSRFQLLQNQSAALQYAVFDCLYKNGRDLRGDSLKDRRSILDDLIRKSGAHNTRIFASTRMAESGLQAYKVAARKGFEGVIAKDESSPYIEGRSNKWLKVKVHQEDEFVIVGYTAPAGARQHFGALLLGAYEDSKLKYVGKVGTGFSQALLASLFRKFQPLVRVKPTVADPPPEKNVTYLAPHLIAQIAYSEWTHDRKLRQPVFLGLRDDLNPREVRLTEEK
jgi:bifunctional non-homologous end joining protein LigD